MTAAIICAGLHFGCGGGAEEETPPAPSGPKEVVLTMLKAIAAGDAGAAVACYDCSTENKEYMVKTMPFQKALMKIGAAGAKEYGAKAWRAAKDKAKLDLIIPELSTAETTTRCTIMGNVATCSLKGFRGSLNLAKRGKRWLIVPQPEQFPKLHLRGEIIESILLTKASIDEIRLRIGAANVSADDICAEVAKILNIR